MEFYGLEHPPSDFGDALTDFLFAPGKQRGDAPLCEKCGRAIGPLPSIPPVRLGALVDTTPRRRRARLFTPPAGRT